MNNIFYHGSIWIFDEFDAQYSSHGGEIFVSPCHCKLPESNKNFRYSREWGNNNCLCRAYSDVSDFKILNVEKIEYDGKPMWELECGGVAIMMDRRFVDRNKQKEV